jgi:hypothetical protein
MTTPHKRQGRWHRDPLLARKLPLDAITHGDRMLVLLDQTQFLTAAQIAHRFFTVPVTADRKPETELARARRAANRSLSRLKDRGWVELVPVFATPARRRLRVIEVNALTKPGIEVVRQLYADDPHRHDIDPLSSGAVDPLPETIAHELAVRDALIFLSRLCETHQLPVHWWTMDTRSLVAASQTHLRHAPDLIMVVGERMVPLLVEVDLGNESIASRAVNSWWTKYGRYADYLQHDFGADPLFARCAKPLVVVLGASPRRVTNLTTAITAWGGQRAWWFATLEELSPLTYRPPGAVWQMASVEEAWSLAEAIRPAARL